ncbi:ABC transporter ATP-binding protein [Pseudonocardia ailaonensis]|uniref:ABC transporter ATP-binding protein n=1 Tax=Pseudonocardia ailaonensis TaxID=367279 RepID=A0ABN2MQJ0_9PSEU
MSERASEPSAQEDQGETLPELATPPEEVVAELAEDMRDAPTTATGARGPILESAGVSMVFGGLRALNEVTFSLKEGEIIGLIGPNGAGKTTFFNCLTGLYTPTSGAVTLRGRPMPQDPARVTEAGVARTFQNIRLFPSMTATENVLVGRHVRMKQGPISSLLHGPRFRRSEAEALDRAEKLLAFVGLSRFSDELARNLPYGDQRRLEIARALATDPSVLLLDEPTAGMNAQETEATRQLIFAIRDLGVSVVVIEHDTKFIFTLCDRVLVLVQGELLVEGSPDEVRGDPRVVEAYLGAPPDEVEAQLQTGAGPASDPAAGPASDPAASPASDAVESES